MANVKIYTTPVCPYCIQAKMLLKNKGVDFEEISFNGLQPEERQALATLTHNYRTVPQIFIGDNFIGYYLDKTMRESAGNHSH